MKALIGKALARFTLGLGRLQLLEDPAGSISDFTYILAHVCLDGSAPGISLAKFSIPLHAYTEGREKVLRFNDLVTERLERRRRAATLRSMNLVRERCFVHNGNAGRRREMKHGFRDGQVLFPIAKAKFSLEVSRLAD